ncbi:hypothetical protein LC608_31735 [Nostoc sp. XA010]|uniref:hypothetical protein n=1 Tax=Nostoc sp. XA010 TaxID=2780407 RepID=UPI001E55DBCD|nr:hypothetical protein [Nostoc sp. XA010]MCC5661445.1 hypothetical protein [Nostoc sp. XA010]
MANCQTPSSAEYRFSSDYNRLIPIDSSQDLPILVKVPNSKPACYKAINNADLTNLTFFSYGSIDAIYESVYPKDNTHLLKWVKKVGGESESRRLVSEVCSVGKLIDEIVIKHDLGQPIAPISFRYHDYWQGIQQILPHLKKPVYLNQGIIVNFQLGVFGVIDRIGAYRNWESTLIDTKAALNPKTNLHWIEDKIRQIAAYLLLNDELYPVEVAGLIFCIKDGTVDEYFFDANQIQPYQEAWLNRLEEVRYICKAQSVA